MTRRKLFRDVSAEAGLLLIGIPVLLWTLHPILPLRSCSRFRPRMRQFSGQLWPGAIRPCANFEIVLEQKHHFPLSFLAADVELASAISCATAVLTLLIASLPPPSPSRACA